MKPKFALVFLLAAICSCHSSKKLTATNLLGSWDNQQGQVLEFKSGGKAYWIFYTETKRDTFNIGYRTDFTTTPLQLDLTDFETGPLKGKTLYGIIAFPTHNSFKFDCEPVRETRPRDFFSKQTQTYYMVK